MPSPKSCTSRPCPSHRCQRPLGWQRTKGRGSCGRCLTRQVELDPGLRLAAGLMLVYGSRPHELAVLRLQDFVACKTPSTSVSVRRRSSSRYRSKSRPDRPWPHALSHDLAASAKTTNGYSPPDPRPAGYNLNHDPATPGDRTGPGARPQYRNGSTCDAAAPGHSCQADGHHRSKSCCTARGHVSQSSAQPARWPLALNNLAGTVPRNRVHTRWAYILRKIGSVGVTVCSFSGPCPWSR